MATSVTKLREMEHGEQPQLMQELNATDTSEERKAILRSAQKLAIELGNFCATNKIGGFDIRGNSIPNTDERTYIGYVLFSLRRKEVTNQVV